MNVRTFGMVLFAFLIVTGTSIGPVGFTQGWEPSTENKGDIEQISGSPVTVTQSISKGQNHSERSDGTSKGEIAQSKAKANTNPDPEFTRIEAPNEVELGNSFEVSVVVENTGGPGGHWSTISLSFPDLDASDDRENIQITDEDFYDYQAVAVAGNEIVKKDGSTTDADYGLAEAGYGADDSWPAGETHRITVELTPEEVGLFPVYLRGTITDDDNTDQKFNEPESSGIEDQQGFNVEAEWVTVIDDPAVSTIGSESVTDSGATLTGQLNSPGNDDTSVYFQYREQGDSNWHTTPREQLSSSSSFSISISELDGGTTYEFRAVGENSAGTDRGNIQTFTTKTPDPEPNLIDREISEDTVEVGESFTISLIAENDGGRAGHWSTISVSFPDLDQSDDGGQFSISSHDFPSYSGTIVASDDVINRQGNTIQANYAIAEAGAGSNGYWAAGSRHELRVTAAPESVGEFEVYSRVTLTDDEDVDQKFTIPASSGTQDQQGYDVYVDTITVIDEPSIETRSATSVTEHQATLEASLRSIGNSQTDVWFQYRPADTGDWQISSRSSYDSAGGVSESLSGLQVGTTYEYRVVAENGAGKVTGEKKTFTTQTPPPEPQLVSTDISDESIALGESFTVTVRAENIGGRAGNWSTITVSFPWLNDSDDKSQLEVIDHDFASYSGSLAAGDDLVHRDGSTIEADYALAEAGSGADGYWIGGSEHTLTVEVTPETAGEFPIQYRVTLTDDESGDVRFTAPSSSSTTDQQGYSVQTTTVDVVKPINARITDFEPPTGSRTVGESITADVTVENTGTTQHTFYVGFSVRNSSDSIFDNEGTTHEGVTLAPGESQAVEVSWDSSEAPPDSYDSLVAVWESEENGELHNRLDSREAEDSFQLEAREIDPSDWQIELLSVNGNDGQLVGSTEIYSINWRVESIKIQVTGPQGPVSEDSLLLKWETEDIAVENGEILGASNETLTLSYCGSCDGDGIYVGEWQDSGPTTHTRFVDMWIGFRQNGPTAQKSLPVVSSTDPLGLPIKDWVPDHHNVTVIVDGESYIALRMKEELNVNPEQKNVGWLILNSDGTPVRDSEIRERAAKTAYVTLKVQRDRERVLEFHGEEYPSTLRDTVFYSEIGDLLLTVRDSAAEALGAVTGTVLSGGSSQVAGMTVREAVSQTARQLIMTVLQDYIEQHVIDPDKVASDPVGAFEKGMKLHAEAELLASARQSERAAQVVRSHQRGAPWTADEAETFWENMNESTIDGMYYMTVRTEMMPSAAPTEQLEDVTIAAAEGATSIPVGKVEQIVQLVREGSFDYLSTATRETAFVRLKRHKLSRRFDENTDQLHGTADEIYGGERVYLQSREPAKSATIEIIDAPSGTFMAKDEVVTTVQVTNTGQEAARFFVGYAAYTQVDGSREYYDNDGTTGHFVTLGAGESKTTDVRWTVDSAPPRDRTYGVGVAVWEAFPAPDVERIDFKTQSNAFEVVEGAEFSLSDARVTTQDLRAGKEVSFAVDVENTGGIEGVTLIRLTNESGSVVDTDNVQLGPGEEATAVLTHTFAEPGQHTVSLGETQLVINVAENPDANEAPNAAITPQSKTVLVDTPVTLDASESTDPDGDTLSFQWRLVTAPSDASVSLPTTDSGEVQFDEPGFYTLRVIVTDGEEPDSATAEILVNDRPQVEVSPPPSQIDAGDPIQLSATVDDRIGETSITWRFPDGETASGANVQHAFDSGTHEIEVIVEDEYGASVSQTVSVSVGGSDGTPQGTATATESTRTETTETTSTESTSSTSPETTDSEPVQTTESTSDQSSTTTQQTSPPSETDSEESGGVEEKLTDAEEEAEELLTEAPGQPGFGIMPSVTALGLVILLILRRRD